MAFRALRLNEAARRKCRQRGPGLEVGVIGKGGENHECGRERRKKKINSVKSLGFG